MLTRSETLESKPLNLYAVLRVRIRHEAIMLQKLSIAPKIIHYALIKERQILANYVSL